MCSTKDCLLFRVVGLEPGDYLFISDPEGASNAGFAEYLLSEWFPIRIEKNGTDYYEDARVKFNNQIDPKYCDGQHTIHISH